MKRVVGFALVAGLSAALVAGTSMPAVADGTYAPLPDAPAPVYSAAVPLTEGESATLAATEAQLAGMDAVPAVATDVMSTPGGVAVGGFALGFTVGSLGVNAVYKITGNDIKDTICVGGTGGQVLGFLYGQDCAPQLSKTIPDSVLDAGEVDKPAGYVSDQYYVSSGSETKLCEFAIEPDSSGQVSCTMTQQTFGSGYTEYYTWLCYNATANTFTQQSQSYPEASQGGVETFTFGCTGGATLYAFSAAAPSKTPCTSSTCLYDSLSALYFPEHNSDSTTVYPLWFSPTAPVAPPASTTDPPFQLECKVIATTGQGYSSFSGTFTKADAGLPPLNCPSVPPGTVPSEVQTTLHDTSGAVPDRVVADQSTTTAYQDFATSEPDCATAGCSFQIAQKLATGTKLCTVGDAACVDWFSDPTKTDDFECVSGPASNPTEYSTALSDCTELSDYYDPAAQAEGKAYTDPATGLATGAQSSPDGDQAQMNEPADDGNPDGSKSACFPSGWGVMNPLSWVVQPVQCVFKWAFIPSKTDLDAVNKKMNQALTASTVGSVLAIVGGWTLNGPLSDAVNGCGIPIELNWAGIDEKYTLLNSCDGALEQPAVITHAVLSAVVPTLGTLAALRYLAAIFGLRPFGEHAGRGAGPALGPMPATRFQESPAPEVNMFGLGSGGVNPYERGFWEYW